jgi:hippurate hydrolase
MPTIEEIRAFHADLTLWRRDIHAHPKPEEQRTSDLVADKLAGSASRCIAGSARPGRRAAAVGTCRAPWGQADMIACRSSRPTFSTIARNTRSDAACGHDGHTTMLLGAARYLAQSHFDGTVHFHLPAGRGGARRRRGDGQ